MLLKPCRDTSEDSTNYEAVSKEGPVVALISPDDTEKPAPQKVTAMKVIM